MRDRQGIHTNHFFSRVELARDKWNSGSKYIAFELGRINIPRGLVEPDVGGTEPPHNKILIIYGNGIYKIPIPIIGYRESSYH